MNYNITAKFGKNRSVDSHWLTTPLKYMLNIAGRDKPRKEKTIPMTLKEAYKQYVEVETSFDETPMIFDDFKKFYIEKILKEPDELKFGLKEYYMKTISSGPDKDFVIIDIMGNHAICAWRNNTRASIGMQFTCPIKKRKGVRYLIYKDKPYKIDEPDGWVW